MSSFKPGTDFFSTCRSPARVLVLDLGFLGDTIHLIPALAVIRKAWPSARLEVMVGEHVKSILAVCPWLDGVRGYPRFPKGPRWHEDFGRVADLRAGKFDAVINLNGSDRSSILTRLTGAPLRLGRVPPKTSWFWSRCFTHTIDVPHGTKPVFLQHLDVLAAAGFPLPENAAQFVIDIPAGAVRAVSARLGEARAFIHVSPFTTQDSKELPLEVLAKFLNSAQAARPDLAFVISTAPNEREKAKLVALRSQLSFEPWRIFPGDLNLIELTALIQRSLLHLGGDSGALHVALMAGTPTLSWWRDYAGRIEWQPMGAKHHTLLGEPTPAGLTGIDAVQLGAAFAAALAGPAA